jgi:crossover junction endodeoxyribonuclease RuvC
MAVELERRARVLGVDPGSRLCGYAVVEVIGRGDCGYLECGVIEAGARLPLEQRLAEVARELAGIIREYAPMAVAVEDVFTGRNVRSALALAHARGTVFAVAGMAGVPVYSYAPSVVKKSVTGQGAASKQQVARMVQVLAGLRSPPRSDAADALAVALAHGRGVSLP